jgi:hypothetical protein
MVGGKAAAAWLAVGDAERGVVRVGETEAAEDEATGDEAEYARRCSAESERASHTDKRRGVCTAARDSDRQLGKVRRGHKVPKGQFIYKPACTYGDRSAWVTHGLHNADLYPYTHRLQATGDGSYRYRFGMGTSITQFTPDQNFISSFIQLELFNYY